MSKFKKFSNETNYIMFDAMNFTVYVDDLLIAIKMKEDLIKYFKNKSYHSLKLKEKRIL